MKNILLIVSVAFLLATSTLLAVDGNGPAADSGKVMADSDRPPANSDQFIVSYLHGNRRCVTCQKLEAYSGEAVSSAFQADLKDSSLVWRVVNFEEEGNEHYAKDYQLYSQSLVVSRMHDGQEVGWKNLDKIWTLVGDKDEFISYVQTEVRNFMAAKDQSSDAPMTTPAESSEE